ncbi:hypothetical protein AAFC00_006652 [Neodothiora populina]|uniref:Swiss Army Knife RNA repair protein HAD domain-containing protein n=1 Tax=Neodothiora populina TaxID=2781224 RepID=A0ABR3PAR9_9PEZI
MSGTSGSTHTITGLKRWSCQDKQLPEVDKIRAIHIYDFDNTLFCSPLPNKQVWNGPAIGQLQALEIFSTGGWWHDVNILASTGKGADEEEKTGWKGWWNENIVDLVQLSMQQKDVLCVLLTGRKESAFAPLISRMIKAKGLEFDMVCLKPAVGPANQKIPNTMAFKQELLKDVVFTYTEAEDLKIYEDRPKHTTAFRQFFSTLNRNLQASQDPDTRPPFTYDVVQVTEESTTLDPVTEVSEVQRMINTHNETLRSASHTSVSRMGGVPLAIKRTVFYTGYLIAPQDTERLLPLANVPTNANSDIRQLGNNILITPRPANASVLQQVGGIGNKVRFRVTHIAALEHKLWAVRVTPTDSSTQVYTENPVPLVVLALKKNARTVDATRIRSHMWQPVTAHQMIEFETVVGEKVLLRIEEEKRGEEEWESQFPSQRGSNGVANRDDGSFTSRDGDFPALGSSAPGAATAAQQQNGQETLNENERNNQNQVPQVDPRAMQFGAAPTGPSSRSHGRRDHGYQHDRPGGGVHKSGQRNGGGRGGNKNFGRGGRNGGRGGGGGNGGGGRGGSRRGGQYRSLDDSVGNSSYGGGGMQY